MTAQSKGRPALVIRIDGHAPDVRLAANDRGNMHWGERSSLVGAEFDKAHWLYKAFFKGNVPPRYTVPALCSDATIGATQS